MRHSSNLSYTIFWSPWKAGLQPHPLLPLLPLEALLLVLSCHSLGINHANLDAVLQTSQPCPLPGGALLTLLPVLGSGLFFGIFAGRSPSPQALLCKVTGNGPFPLLLAHYVFPAPWFSVTLLPSLKGSHWIDCHFFFWFCWFQNSQVQEEHWTHAGLWWQLEWRDKWIRCNWQVLWFLSHEK